MNTGLQDAHNLGWKLAHVCRGEAGEALIDSYEAERRPVAELIVASGAAADANQARLDQAQRAARNARVVATFSDPDAVQLELASGAEIDRYYGQSAIVSGVPQEDVVGPAAGRLLPLTTPVRTPDGQDVALHDLARRLGHTLFVLGDGASTAEVTAGLDRLGSVPGAPFVDAAYGLVVGVGDGRVGTMSAETAAQLGVDGLTVLAIRPDRYIGMRRDGTDTDGIGYLADYLAALTA